MASTFSLRLPLASCINHYSTIEEPMNFKSLFFTFMLPFFSLYSMERKPVALTNIGNSCFMNAPLQALLSLTELSERLREYEEMYQPGSFTRTYSALIKDALQQKKIDPLNLRTFCLQGWNTLGSRHFTQQDAGEFLQKALEHFTYKDINNTTFYSTQKDVNNQPITEISELFSIKTTTQILAPSIDYYGTKKPESSLSLTLPLSSSKRTLQEHLTDFFSPELLENYKIYGVVQFDAHKLVQLDHLGKYVIISLKRTTYGANWTSVRKENPISFPLNGLSFRDYFNNPAEGKSSYDLKAFILHTGGKSAAAGHYTAYVRYGAQWYKCDDSSITLAQKATVETIARLGYATAPTVLPTTFIYEISTSSSLTPEPQISHAFPPYVRTTETHSKTPTFAPRAPSPSFTTKSPQSPPFPRTTSTRTSPGTFVSSLTATTTTTPPHTSLQPRTSPSTNVNRQVSYQGTPRTFIPTSPFPVTQRAALATGPSSQSQRQGTPSPLLQQKAGENK